MTENVNKKLFLLIFLRNIRCGNQRNSPSSSLLSGSGFLIRRLFFFSVFSSSLSDSARLVLLPEGENTFR